MKTLISAAAITAILLSHTASAHEAVPVELPVGDGKVSAEPKAGYVFACNTNFRQGGARHYGDWFKGETWNPLEKPHVQGEVYWPDAYLRMTEDEKRLSVETNGLPVGTATGEFPIARTDPVYQYDTNPNPIKPLEFAFPIPRDPVAAGQPSCLGMGMIGFSVTGVAFYNALDDAGLDAAAHEVQDLCNGHPQGKGQYHYHSSSPCIAGAEKNELVGWALDGFPILGMRNADGSLIKNEDLDVCHGRSEDIVIDGRTHNYAYRLTAEYPYIMGCYTGQLLPETRQSIRETMGPPRQRGVRGPQGNQAQDRGSSDERQRRRNRD